MFNKTKKSLNSILSVFNKTREELQEWEELSAEEQRELQQRLTQIKAERQQAETVIEQLDIILGKKKA